MKSAGWHRNKHPRPGLSLLQAQNLVSPSGMIQSGDEKLVRAYFVMASM
jgi:hypothetical protein